MLVDPLSEKVAPETPGKVRDREEVSGDPFAALKRLMAIERGPTNLPSPPAALIGRDKELKTVRELLLSDDLRLVTLTGPGGTGKTRLGLEIAAALTDRFPGGVFLVSLASTADPSLVLPSIASTLGVVEGKNRSIIESIKEHLRDKPALLLLDNFEQVIDAASHVAELLSECPKVKILATSRAPLRIRGEHEFPVKPLTLPDLDKLPELEALVGYPAVALFVLRAKEVRPEFSLTTKNARIVAEICARLDGLPLALELAAARIRILTVGAMLTRLENRLQLLTTGTRDMPTRHRTLRDTISWSYNLLDEQDKKLFRRLSVFAGHFSLQTAEAVGNLPSDLPEDILDGLTRLVERSLLVHEYIAEESRFRMLETIREFAFELLGASNESQLVTEYYADFFVSLLEKTEQELKGPGQAEMLGRLDREHDNLRGVLRWSIENKDADRTLRCVSVLWRFWYFRGYLTEGRTWLANALAITESARTTLRAKTLYGAGALAASQYDLASAQALLNESVALSRELGDKETMAFSLNSLGIVIRDQGNFVEGNRLHEESIALFQEIGNKWGTALALNNRGVSARNQGDYEKANAFHQQSMQLFTEIGDKRYVARQLINLGIIRERKAEYDAARELLDQALRLSRELGEKIGTTESLALLGTVARKQGDYVAARKLIAESLAKYRELGDREGIASCFDEFAGCASAEGQLERTALFLGIADGLREAVSSHVPPAYQTDRERDITLVRSALGKEVFLAEWGKGRTMNLEEAIGYVIDAFRRNIKDSEDE